MHRVRQTVSPVEWSAGVLAGHPMRRRPDLFFGACVEAGRKREEVTLRVVLSWPAGRAALHGAALRYRSHSAH